MGRWRGGGRVVPPCLLPPPPPSLSSLRFCWSVSSTPLVPDPLLSVWCSPLVCGAACPGCAPVVAGPCWTSIQHRPAFHLPPCPIFITLPHHKHHSREPDRWVCIVGVTFAIRGTWCHCPCCGYTSSTPYPLTHTHTDDMWRPLDLPHAVVSCVLWLFVRQLGMLVASTVVPCQKVHTCLTCLLFLAGR